MDKTVSYGVIVNARQLYLTLALLLALQTTGRLSKIESIHEKTSR